MTTIAYKDNRIACDSQATTNGMAVKATKFVKTKNHIYFVSGALADGFKFIEWLLSDKESEHPKFKADVIEFNRKTGEVFVYEGTDCGVMSEGKFEAWGSGAQIAMGAMAAGADCETAVKIACDLDTHTGKKVKVFSTK